MYSCKGCGAKNISSPSKFCSKSCYINWYRRTMNRAKVALKKIWE